jgi:hypothetical protein
MTAVGIAGLATLHMDPGLKKHATQWYLKAIKMANVALSDPDDARNDTTLVGVNLLSMLEAQVNDESLVGWIRHVEGAASLLKLRGKDQFSTLAGRRMYIQSVGLVTQSYMGQGLRVPDFIQELNKEIEPFLNLRDPRHAYFFLHGYTCNFRGDIFSQKMTDLEKIIERAMELDAVAVGIFEGVRDAWHYDIVPCLDDQPSVFGDFYHVYPTHATAQTWNWVRYNRIYYHDIIRNCILSGFAASPPVLTGPKYYELLASSTRTLQELQSDILASMPQFLHDTPKVAPQETSSTDSSRRSLTSTQTARSTPEGTPLKSLIHNFQAESIEHFDRLAHGSLIEDRLPILRISGGYSVIWALYVAGAMPTASPASQEFVLRCLDRMEHEFGINQGRVLARYLRIKRQMVNGGESPFTICPRYSPPESGF